MPDAYCTARSISDSVCVVDWNMWKSIARRSWPLCSRAPSAAWPTVQRPNLFCHWPYSVVVRSPTCDYCRLSRHCTLDFRQQRSGYTANQPCALLNDRLYTQLAVFIASFLSDRITITNNQLTCSAPTRFHCQHAVIGRVHL